MLLNFQQYIKPNLETPAIHHHSLNLLGFAHFFWEIHHVSSLFA